MLEALVDDHESDIRRHRPEHLDLVQDLRERLAEAAREPLPPSTPAEQPTILRVDSLGHTLEFTVPFQLPDLERDILEWLARSHFMTEADLVAKTGSRRIASLMGKLIERFAQRGLRPPVADVGSGQAGRIYQWVGGSSE